jgi:SAM-dependent methyltransferase
MMVLDPYAQAAQYYDQYRPEYPSELIQFIIDLSTTHESYLDLGCGTGTLLFNIAPAFTQATGVDIDEEMFQASMLKKQDPQFSNVSVIRGSAEDFLANGNESFDLITLGRSIHWMDQPVIFENAYTALKPGGILAMVGEETSLWQRTTPPFLKIYEIIREIEEEKGLRHTISQGNDTPFQTTLELLKQTPFKSYTQTSFSMGYQWDIDHILGYFYSASGFLNWLNRDRDRFEQQCRAALQKLSPDGIFFESVQFGITCCRK